MPKKKLLWPGVGAAVLFVALLYGRGFPPLYALIASVAGGALVYWSLRTAENLRRMR